MKKILQTWRWFRPVDSVSLSDMSQAEVSQLLQFSMSGIMKIPCDEQSSFGLDYSYQMAE